ncbi:large subunit ribosomal protein L15 [Marchantia polymorpha subsp. ruderalis]|uniref:Large ribosomal subunit protein uL15/eL18 domain-containing protein n=2 Tax=Marchantia polymorpha TaxID=3197 RepID=A0A176WFP4_MARPO|nr:hypothetical protein AXG93_2278s1090 [Marchantia polymorpha subsp. ruderalis]PTQ44518.1 hypothetical protein MARPO_0020s0151 [Marchantia polymorpha]BBN09944.1 hypothetical protein Mp_4g23920 [Marchantia polymorpha subsp. ruderalis]|eukprot:PTQ44518.1 hypothetical protein MARPO_0020s0151 [Marchantia polymorpha]
MWEICKRAGNGGMEKAQRAWMMVRSATFSGSAGLWAGEVKVLGGKGWTGSVSSGGLLPLNGISDNKGSRKDRTRLGRGIGSGKGKTAGRGHKGQKARSGHKPRLGFEGGQTPLRLRIPKRGFTNTLGQSYQPVNLNKIAELVSKGRIDASQLITMKTLKDAGAVGKKMLDGMKLLGRGSEHFSLPIHIEVSRVSERAKVAIEAAGGSVRRVHYNQLGLKALLDPDWFHKKGRLLPQPARPPLKVIPKVDGIGSLPAPVTPPPSAPTIPETTVSA